MKKSSQTGPAIKAAILKIAAERYGRDEPARKFDPAGAARALAALKNKFLVAEEEIIKKYLPLLGLPPSRHFLDLYLTIDRLPLFLKKALASGHLLPEMAPLILKFKPAEQKFLWRLGQKYHLSASRVRQLWQYLDDLRQPGGRWDKGPGLQARLGRIRHGSNSGRIPLQQKGEKLVEEVRQIRSPHLAELENKFEALKRRLKLPPEIILRPADNWEGTFQLTVRFNNTQQLRQSVKKIAAVADDRDLADFLNSL